MNISIVGATGAGKGTQIAQLIRRFKIVSFAPGDLFRQGVKQRSPLGLLAEKYLKCGELVPDDVVNSLLEEWLSAIPSDQGIVLDGFPRTTYQAVFLEEAFRRLGRKLDAVIYLEVSDGAVISRLSNRRECRLCHAVFHLLTSPFKACPQRRCEGQYLRQLEEDMPGFLWTINNVFQTGVRPLLHYFAIKGELITINGDGSIEEVHEAIVNAVEPCRR